MKHHDHSCQEVWERSLDARRGDLSDLEALRLEEEMARCERCARRARRITAALDQAAQEEPAHWLDAPLDADALFGRIEAALDHLDQPSAQPEEAEAPGQPQLEAQASGDPRSTARPAWLWIAVAASLLLGLGAGLLWGQLGAAPGPTRDAQVAQGDPWLRQGQTPPSVGLYARSQARWEITGQQDYTLHVAGGELLVDFTPLGEDALTIQVGQLKARVVGTVVYIKATDPAHPELGVLTGAVEVQAAQGAAPVLLRDGQSTRGPLPQALTQEADALLDLERHRQLVQRLRQANAAPPSPQAPSQAPQEEVLPVPAPAPTPTPAAEEKPPQLAQARRARRAEPAAGAAPQAAPKPTAVPRRAPSDKEKPVGASRPPEAPQATPASKEPTGASQEPTPSPEADLPTQARRALGRRDYREAARLHEAWLRSLPTHSGQAATVRLELTRLYLRKLNRRADAMEHLRALLRDNGGDPIAVEARAQLCGLLGPRAAQDPACREPSSPR